MNNVLVINASIQADQGNSSLLTSHFVSQLDASVNLVVKSLAQHPVPHLNGDEFSAWLAGEDRTPAQQELVAISDRLVSEVQAADTIVLGVPMYNFGIPSTLKAWIDHIARAGVTFQYTENGPVGLLDNKRVIILIASGGKYQGTPKDTVTPYLTTFFNFLGIDDISFVYAEGLAMGEAETAISLAKAEIDALV